MFLQLTQLLIVSDWNERQEHAFEELTIAFESSLKPENFVYVQPAGVSNFSWVEFEVSRQPFL